MSRSRLASCSNGTNERGVFGGGWDDSGGRYIEFNRIDYITINHPGNASDFGDLSIAQAGLSACSDFS